MCERLGFGNGWLVVMIAAPIALTTSVWLIGKFFGQRGNWWLTGLCMPHRCGCSVHKRLLEMAMYLPVVLDILVPMLAIPFFAYLVMYQLSPLIVN